MTASIPIAFYAPLKSPNHPAPSGERTMARLLLKALAAAGFAPELASEIRTLDKAGDAGAQGALRAASEADAARLIAAYRARPPTDRPRLWFTYHCYYKAPDWLGPRVADALGISYAVAEGSRAGKRARGPWAFGHAGAEAALNRADLVLVMTAADREALERARRPGQRIAELPPFLDVGEWAPVSSPPPPAAEEKIGECRLLTVAMMRPGDKLASYRILAEALLRLRDLPWSLTIVGDGPARVEIEALFAPLGGRVAFLGQVDETAALRDLYAAADLFVWPAVNEAYGMVFLEAQAMGCPVVAGAFGGVPSVVEHGRTGLLTLPGDPDDLARGVASLIEDAADRRHLGAGAERFVRQERGLEPAARRLREALLPLVERARA